MFLPEAVSRELVMRCSILFPVCLALLASGCGKLQPNAPGDEQRRSEAKRATAKRLKEACGSAETYNRLKALTFDQAASIRGTPSPLLDQLAAASTLRMEQPVVKSRDETLNVTVCAGKFILDLPPGTQDAFDGARRLEANIDYAAQEAVDGSGLVYQIQGAEPIIYRLAAIDLRRDGLSSAPPSVVADDGAQPLRTPFPRPQPPRAELPPPLPPMLPVSAPPAPATVRSSVPRMRADRPRPVARPSFNCRDGGSRVEQMICNDPALAARDRAMSAEFFAALADGDPGTRADLRKSRTRFLRYRDSCADEECVAQAYADRIAEIRDIAR